MTLRNRKGWDKFELCNRKSNQRIKREKWLDSKRASKATTG